MFWRVWRVAAAPCALTHAAPLSSSLGHGRACGDEGRAAAEEVEDEEGEDEEAEGEEEEGQE